MPRGRAESIKYNGEIYKSLRQACEAAGVNHIYIVRYRDRRNCSTQEAFDSYLAGKRGNTLKNPGGSELGVVQLSQIGRAAPIELDGVVYRSAAEAIRVLGLSVGRITYLRRVRGCSTAEAVEAAYTEEFADKSWSETELEMLRTQYWYKGSDIPELRKHRTSGAIRAMAIRQGLTSNAKYLGNEQISHVATTCGKAVYVECAICNEVFLIPESEIMEFTHERHKSPVPAGWALPKGAGRFDTVICRIHKCNSRIR